MLGVVVCASAVADTILVLLQEDDRVVLQLPLIEEEIELTLDYVANLPESVVVAVASVAGLSSTKLRHEFT